MKEFLYLKKKQCMDWLDYMMLVLKREHSRMPVTEFAKGFFNKPIIYIVFIIVA